MGRGRWNDGFLHQQKREKPTGHKVDKEASKRVAAFLNPQARRRTLRGKEKLGVQIRADGRNH